MSSVDLSPAGQRPQASPQQLGGSSGRYNVHNTRYGAPPPRSGSSTGRTKTEQVVLEFLYKAAELIVQSRVNLQAEPDLRRGSRRARFNLDIEEVQAVRESMAAWKEDVRLPLAIDIFWDVDGHKVLLERWSVTFAADGERSAHLGSTQDVIQQLKEVCKRISVLLRALFSFMRQLPAHRLFAQSYPSVLSYTMHAAPAPDATRAFAAQRVATSGYSFIPIATPFGLLKVAAVYRRDCDQFMEHQEQAAPSRIFQENYIIQDYVPGSPDLVPASAPAPCRTSAAMADAPMRVTDLRADSFVPVSDAEQFGGDVDTPQRRRSTPQSIPTRTIPSAQQFSSTGPVGDVGRVDEEVAARPQAGMSRPMAIPRVNSKAGIASDAAAARYGDEQSDARLVQHAHSYGGEHDVRQRGAAADPNVTAAPYGYGNVAIEREQQHASSPSLAFQQRQQQLWEGSSHQDTEGGLHASQSSFHDEPPTSNSNAAYHRLSTPPRHPRSISLLRNGRTSPGLPHKPFLAGNDSHPVPGSLENFTLDTASPSPMQQLATRRRNGSFNGAFVSESGDPGASVDAPPMGFAEGDDTAQDDAGAQAGVAPAAVTTVTEAMAIGPSTAQQAPSNGMPMFSSSPPFQANPCELLSTSPGYSYSKNYLRSGSSNVPTFITTDQFQLGLHGAKRASFSSSAGLLSARKRGFSPDFSDSGVTQWGISPDTPDAFGLALVDTAGSSSGGRPRFLSLSGSAEMAGASDGRGDDFDAAGADMMLPFAIGDGSTIGSSATTAADSVSTGAGSALNRSSLDTASVGTFLHQLKHAPRLSTPASALTPSVPAGDTADASDKPEPAATSLFDDELAGFRSLRDELAQVL